MAAIWEVDTGELGCKETQSKQVERAACIHLAICAAMVVHIKGSELLSVYTRSISVFCICGSVGHKLPQVRQLILKLWVWLGWTLHQAGATSLHTKHQLTQGQLFLRWTQKHKGQMYFCLLLTWYPLISLGQSKSHDQAENQASDKYKYLFAKLQNKWTQLQRVVKN